MSESEYNGDERRKAYREMEKDIQSLKMGVALINQKHSFIEKSLVDHIKDTKEGFGDIKRITGNISAKLDMSVVSNENFSSHVTQDRWMFGVILTMQIGIFVKMFL